MQGSLSLTLCISLCYIWLDQQCLRPVLTSFSLAFFLFHLAPVKMSAINSVCVTCLLLHLVIQLINLRFRSSCKLQATQNSVAPLVKGLNDFKCMHYNLSNTSLEKLLSLTWLPSNAKRIWFASMLTTQNVNKIIIPKPAIVFDQVPC